jgi:hypothetical protein
VCISRRAMHASCESPWHVSAKHHILGACFSLMAPFRTRFSRYKMAHSANVQRLVGCLYTLRYFYIPSCRFTAQPVTVDARVAPHTSASKPCMRVSPHTAPQLLSPCHGCMQDVPCLVNPLLQQKKELFFSSLPSFDGALSLRLWSHVLLAALPSQ